MDAEEGTEEVVEAPVEEPAAELSEEDVPTTWMNVDLSDLPAAGRASAIEQFKQQESYIGKLQHKLAERKAEPEAEPVAQFVEPEAAAPSDDEILKAYGYEPDNIIAKELLPVLKQNLMLVGQMDYMNQQLQTEQAWDAWNSTLDNMETQFGELPVDRDAVVDFAVQQGIQDPEVAYYRLAMQAQKMTVDAAQAQRLKQVEDLRDKKRQTVGVRPTTSRPPTQGANLEPTGNISEDIKRAAAIASEELGISWDDAAQSFLDRR